MLPWALRFLPSLHTCGSWATACSGAAQLRGPLKTQHGLSNKRLRQGKAAALGGADSFACVTEQTLDIEPVQGMHDALVQGCQPKFKACRPLTQSALQECVLLAVAVPSTTAHSVGAFICVLVNQMVPLPSGCAYPKSLKFAPLKRLIATFGELCKRLPHKATYAYGITVETTF